MLCDTAGVGSILQLMLVPRVPVSIGLGSLVRPVTGNSMQLYCFRTRGKISCLAGSAAALHGILFVNSHLSQAFCLHYSFEHQVKRLRRRWPVVAVADQLARRATKPATAEISFLPNFGAFDGVGNQTA